MTEKEHNYIYSDMLKETKEYASKKELDKPIASLSNRFSNINIDSYKNVFKIYINNDDYIYGILIKIYDSFYIVTLAHSFYITKECYIYLEKNKIMGTIEVLSFDLDISLIKLNDSKNILINYINDLDILELNKDDNNKKNFYMKMEQYFKIKFPEKNDCVHLYKNNEFIESKIVSIEKYENSWIKPPIFAINDNINSKNGDCGCILLNKDKRYILGMLFCNFYIDDKPVVGFIPSIFICRILREYLHNKYYNGLCILMMSYKSFFDDTNNIYKCNVINTFKYNYNVQTNLNCLNEKTPSKHHIKNGDIIIKIDNKYIELINDEEYIMFDEIGILVTLDAYTSLNYFVNESISLEIDRENSVQKKFKINCRPYNSIINALNIQKTNYIYIKNLIFVNLSISYLYSLVKDKIYEKFDDLVEIFAHYKYRKLEKKLGDKVKDGQNYEKTHICNNNIILLVPYSTNKSERLIKNKTNLFELYKINNFEIYKKNICIINDIIEKQHIDKIELINIKTDEIMNINFN